MVYPTPMNNRVGLYRYVGVATPTGDIVNVGVATTELPPVSALAGTVAVIVSVEVMLYEANAVRVMVTVVSSVRTTAATPNVAFTTASHPNASDWAESIPLIMFCLSASNATPEATHVSFVRVNMIVFPPATMSDSVIDEVTVPLNTQDTAFGGTARVLLILCARS